MHIGVISDTHGLLRPKALEALAGSDLILHAGDIGTPEVLAELGQIAPVIAVRGNVDKGPWAEAIPERETVNIAGVTVYILHSIKDLDLDPKAAGIRVVISGHSHKPAIATSNGVVFLNPGSAGPRRFKLPISLARLQIEGDAVEPALVELQV
ncbi:MAG: metallophosphoesterase family protein [Cyanobacteria bacterium Co-bin13]|nr:metallophosphoesterase family protein [Cyanobacteria bacterium Co-bin13]